MNLFDLDDEVADIMDMPKPASTRSVPPPKQDSGFDDIATDDDPLIALAAKVEMQGDLTQPWMEAYGLSRFQLVRSVVQLKGIVDKCMTATHFGLDLETEGFDNRVDYDQDGKPSTRHKIVGYCLAVDNTGYYVPVRHSFDARYGEQDQNLPVSEADAEIARLCWACQPKITDGHLFGKTDGAPHPVACFFNAKFDQEFLYPVTGLDIWHTESFEDMYLAGYTINSDEGADTGLKEYSERLLSFKSKLGEQLPLKMIKFLELFPKEVKNKNRRFKDLYPKVTVSGRPLAVVLYGCSDAICTLLLSCPQDQLPEGVTRKEHFIEEALTPNLRFTYTLEKRVTQTVRVMERTRGLVDQAEIEKVREEAHIELEEIKAKIKRVAADVGLQDFNPSSFEQVADLLFDKLDLNPKPPKTEKGQYQTTMKVLEALVEDLGEAAPQVIRWIVIHRQITKAVGTYLDAMASDTDEQGRLRYNFKQTGTATGRFTAPKGKEDHGFAGIPIQGIPAREDATRPKCATSLRRIFIPHTGYAIVKVDYAGQELRVVANISGEPVWIKEFLEGSGDLHTLTAQSFWPGLTKSDPDFKSKRHKAKAGNFSLVYGGGVQAIMRATGVDKEDAAQKLAGFNKSVPRFALWCEGQHRLVKAQRGVRSGFSRWMALPDAATTEKDVLERLKRAGKEEIPAWQAKKEANKIRSACERKSTNYPIQGSGADILKISLVKLLSELTAKGWLRTGLGGDDSVRLLMTVHDEVVFEVRKDRLNDAMPVIIECMEYASVIRKDWPVPLIVEPLVGTSWDAKYDWLSIKDGKEPVPAFLEGCVEVKGQEIVEGQPAGQPEQAPITERTPTAVAGPVKLDSITPSPIRLEDPPEPSGDEFTAALMLTEPVNGLAGTLVVHLGLPLTDQVTDMVSESIIVSEYLVEKHGVPNGDFLVRLQVDDRAKHTIIRDTDNIQVLFSLFGRHLKGTGLPFNWELIDDR